MHRLAPLAALLAALLLPLSAWGLTIDDFSGTTQSVTDCTGADGNVSSEETHSVLGGARLVTANALTNLCVTTTVGGGTATIETDSGASGGGSFLYDGAVDGSFSSTSGSLNVDLTQGGTLDRFAIEVLSVTNFSNDLNVNVTVWDADSGSVVAVADDVTSAGDYEILFSAYSGVDFTDIRAIRLSHATNLTGDASFVYGSFSAAIPEPSTALLVALGLAGLAAARGRRIVG